MTLDQAIDVVNNTGRSPKHPKIVAKATCARCSIEFASQASDAGLRASKGYTAYCPKCRDVIRREQNAERAREKRKK